MMRLVYFLLIMMISCASCGDRSLVTVSDVVDDHSIPKDEDSLPSRWELFGAYSNNEILIVYDAKDEEISKQYEILISDFTANLPPQLLERFTINFKNVNEVTPNQLSNKIVYMTGVFEDHPVVNSLSDMLPFSNGSDSFSFNNQEYSSPEDVIVIQNFPNPNQSRLPFSLVTGNGEEAVLSVFTDMLTDGARFFRNSFDYSIYNNGSRLMMGAFDNNWQIDEDQIFKFPSIKEPVLSSKHLDVYSQSINLTKEQLRTLSEKIENRISSIKEFLDSNKEIQRFNYYIYQSAEEKGLQELNSQQAHVNYSTNSIHTVINEKYKDNFIERENRYVIRSLLGESSNQVLEDGLAISFTDSWQSKGYLYWAARLAESGNALTLKELTNDQLRNQESPLIVECMAGVLTDFLIKQWGKDIFLKKYSSWNPTAQDLADLTSHWDSYLNSLILSHPKQTRTTNTGLGLKGFNFAHEGYRIYNGYMSKLATQAIQKQVDIGSNAIAIVPYSYMRDDQKPIPLPILQSPGQENDEGVIHSAYEAKERGMKTMLKPQIWLSNAWPGSIEMKSEEDWKLFYSYYHKWIRHYALLAEIHGIDMLSVGVEFVKSTLAHEDEWRKIIRSVRGLYSGQITYSANWGDEFEKLAFGDALDFIGINCYYPLSKKNEVSDAELRRNFERIKDQIKTVYQKYQKPIVFTEIGFRSINTPWKNPHAEGDDSFNEQHQARCYKVILEGIQDEEWCGGILWWKYPSYLNYGGSENNSFTPHNKLAEQTVQKYFTRAKAQQ